MAIALLGAGDPARAEKPPIRACVARDGVTRILLDPAATCKSNETPVQWAEQGPVGPQGPAGQDGLSVQNVSIGPGDPVCPYGGTQFLGSSVTYACNGAPGSSGGGGGGFARTVVVGPVGTPEESGAALLHALSLINPIDPVSERWLLKIEPGVYLLNDLFIMKPGVDVEGSGERSTTILGPVVVAEGTELRALRVEWNENSPPSVVAEAVVKCQGGPLGSSVRQVSIGGTRPVITGLWCGGFSAIRDVTIAVSGIYQAIGIRTGAGPNRLQRIHGADVTSVASNGAVGLLSDNPGPGAVQVDGSAIRGLALDSFLQPSISVQNVGPGTVQIEASQLVGHLMGSGINIGASQLAGAPLANFGITCVASYSDLFAPLLPSCQPF